MGGLSRRSVLGGAGAFALAGMLSACNRGTPPSVGGASPAADRSLEEPVVRWAGWPLQLDYDDDSGGYPSLQTFQDRAQISVAYSDEITSNQQYYDTIAGRLRSGADIGRDVITVSDWLAAQLIRQGSVQKLDKTNIANWSNIQPWLKNPAFDPGRVYSLTWQAGFTGIAYAKALKRPVRSVADLWRADLRGKVTVLAEMRDTMGVLMLAQGIDIAGDFGSDNFGDALAQLEKQVGDGQISRVAGAGYTDDLVSGKTLACIAWSSDIEHLNATHGNKWEFVKPATGATLWTNNLVVPIGSPHKQNAEILMNYYYDPGVAARIASAVHGISPVAGARAAMQRLDVVQADDPLIFPTEQQLDQAKTFRQLTAAEEAQYNADFADVAGLR